MQDCVFCKIIKGQIPSTIVSQTDDLIVIKDVAPKAPIHLLIIPKKHVKDIQSLEEGDNGIGSLVFKEAQALSKQIPGAEHFKLVINNGFNAGQRVFHLHAHFLVGYNGQEV